MDADNVVGDAVRATDVDNAGYRVLRLTLNGTLRQFSVRPDLPLLDLLREEAGLTGAKRGCEMGNCGACTVSLDGKSVYSCLVLASECHGREVGTVEGLANGDTLHPLQQAFIDKDAYQCGYCTPGQLMSLSCLFADDASPDEQSIVNAVSGNLCRCGAYRHIREAALQVADDSQRVVSNDASERE